MRELYKTDLSGFVKDENKRAVLNNDSEGLKAYKKKKAQNRKLNLLEKRINNIEDALNNTNESLQRIEKILNANN